MKQQPTNDPFLDPGLGPEVWTRVRPDRTQYWPFVLLLAIGLTGFSFYWQNQILPQQPLVWQSAADLNWQSMLQDREPTLIWLAPIPLDGATEADDRGSLDEAIKALDTPELRRATRLKSARLWKFESPMTTAVQQVLLQSWAANTGHMADQGGLILWQPDERRRKFLLASQIQASQVEQWLLATRAEDAP